MRAILLAVVAVATVGSSYSQIYGARRYTQRIQPQVRPAPPNARPNNPQQPQQPPQTQPVAPQQPVPAPPVYQPQYRTPIATAAAAPKPVDPAKAAAEKAKNDEKQFEFFKRRAEEGSDHAQYELGLRYLSGRGVAADEKLGREWLAKAAKNGNSQAAKKLDELGGASDVKIEPAPATVESKPATEAK